MTVRVREAVAHLRINIDDPKLTLKDAYGRRRSVYGLRLDYVRRSDGLVRTDVIVEYKRSSRLVLPVEDHPQWLLDVVDSHRPAFLDAVDTGDHVRVGMGSFPTPTDVTAPVNTAMGRLLVRAAAGDQQASADFDAMRTTLLLMQERFRELARQQALRMISSSNHPAH